MTGQERCRRRDPRGHQCELPGGHAGEHQRQPPVLTWPEWRGGDATEGKGEMLECLECGDERSENRLNPIDWGVGLGLCCCSAEVHVTRHELDEVRAERDEARGEAEQLRERIDRTDERGTQWLRDLTDQDATIERLTAERDQLLDALRSAAGDRSDDAGQQAVMGWAQDVLADFEKGAALRAANERRRQTIARYWDDEDDDPPATAREQP